MPYDQQIGTRMAVEDDQEWHRWTTMYVHVMSRDVSVGSKGHLEDLWRVKKPNSRFPDRQLHLRPSFEFVVLWFQADDVHSNGELYSAPSRRADQANKPLKRPAEGQFWRTGNDLAPIWST